MESLYKKSKRISRSISAENFTGEKGKGGMATEGTGKQYARDLGMGWKISPSVIISPGEIFILADILEQSVISQKYISKYCHKTKKRTSFPARCDWLCFRKSLFDCFN